MRMFILFLYFAISISCLSQSRELSQNPNQSKFISIVDSNECIKHLTKDKNVLFFSIADKWGLMIIENNDFYKELYIKNDSLMSSENISKSNEILKLAFNKEIYHTGFIGPDFYSQNIKYSAGNNTYFCFVSQDDKIYGETEATTIIIPPPIEESVYNYLLKELLDYITYDKDE